MEVPENMLGAKPHTVTRFAPGAYDDEGEYVPGDESQIIVRGSLQPLSAFEVRQLEGGDRAGARWSLLTTEQLQVSSSDARTIGDELHYKDQRLVVVGVNDFSDAPFLPHYEYLLALKEV